MNNCTDTNQTTNTVSPNALGENQGGSDVGGIGNLSRQLLGQQAELLAKIDLILESQARLERTLQTSRIAADNTVLGGLARKEGTSASV